MDVDVCYRTCNGYCEFLTNEVRVVDYSCFIGLSVQDQRVVEAALAAVLQGLISQTAFNCPNQIPSCTSATKPVYKAYTSSCRRAEKRVTEGSVGVNFIPCGTGQCSSLYEACYDYSVSPPLLKLKLVGSGQVGECEYSSNPWILPDPSTVPGQVLIPCSAWCSGF